LRNRYYARQTAWWILGSATLNSVVRICRLVRFLKPTDAEFERCIVRRGEALSLDEGPTYGYFPLVYYYQGRAREALTTTGFAESYRTYLNIRGKAGEDSLLPEVRRRLQVEH
jgi:hypothetical protein